MQVETFDVSLERCAVLGARCVGIAEAVQAFEMAQDIEKWCDEWDVAERAQRARSKAPLPELLGDGDLGDRDKAKPIE